jgi:hypothetical protein
MPSPLARGLRPSRTDAEIRGFWNDVLANTEGVLLAILAALRA